MKYLIILFLLIGCSPKMTGEEMKEAEKECEKNGYNIRWITYPVQGPQVRGFYCIPNPTETPNQ